MEQGRKRQANFELLRITAMFLVVCLHYLSHTDALTMPGVTASGTQILGDLLEALCIVAVNVYVLITGWFQPLKESDRGTENRHSGTETNDDSGMGLFPQIFRLSKLIKLLAEILFYTLLIPLGMTIIGIHPQAQNIWDRWFWFLPVSMEAYWFITAYVILYILSPFLNAGLRSLPQKKMRELLLVLLFFCCVLPSLSPVKLTTDSAGYDALWFAVLYLLAGYLHRYGCPWLEKASHAALLYLGSSLLLWLLTLALHRVSMGGRLMYYADVTYHYNFVLTLTSSLGLFYWFRGVRIREGRAADLIRRIAPSTLGVYLIHENIDVRDRWLEILTRFLGPVPQGALLILHMLACTAVLYICCLLLDGVRRAVFAAVGRAFRTLRK